MSRSRWLHGVCAGVTTDALLKLGVLWPPSIWAESGSGSLVTPRRAEQGCAGWEDRVLLQCGATFHPPAQQGTHTHYTCIESAHVRRVCTWSVSARCARTTDGTKRAKSMSSSTCKDNISKDPFSQ